MAGPQTQPTILTICGAFCPDIVYKPLRAQLESLGFETYCKTNASCVVSTPSPSTPACDLQDDAEAVRVSIWKLCGDQGKDVVLLAHSYGGGVATECLKDISGGPLAGKGRVKGIVYLNAPVPIKGEDMAKAMAEKGVTFDGFSIEHGWMSCKDADAVGELFFNDLPVDERAVHTKQLGRSSLISTLGRTSHDGWRDVGTGYITCDQDRCIPPWLQQEWIERVEKETGREMDVVHLSGGHCANITMPKRCAEAVRDVVKNMWEMDGSAN